MVITACVYIDTRYARRVRLNSEPNPCPHRNPSPDPDPSRRNQAMVGVSPLGLVRGVMTTICSNALVLGYVVNSFCDVFV